MANEIVWAANSTAVSGIDTDINSLALLPDATGFDWKLGNSTREAGFDPNEHIVLVGDKPVSTGAWHRRLPGDQPQLRDFGAKGDGTSIGGDSDREGQINSGQTVLVIGTPRFASADVGRSILVVGAGVAGADLLSTIAGYTNDTTVTLAHSASTTVVGSTVYWGGAKMTAGQPTLTIASPSFTASDVGKVVAVTDPAPGGDTLVSTITAYTNPNTVTLAHPSPTNMAGAGAYWGTDDTNAIQDAINFMASYPVRSRGLFVPRGSYMFSLLTIPGSVLGLSFNGISYWDSTLVCYSKTSDPAIDNKSQEFKMFDMSLISAVKPAVNWSNNKIGLRNDKGYTPVEPRKFADVDSVISRCRISGFSRAVYHKGRSLVMRGFNHIATCDWGIEFDWPDVADYQQNEFGVGSDYLGFRGNIVEGLRVHAPGNGAILNDRPNAYKARGLKLDNIILDIGRTIFKGHLGIGGMLTNAVSMMTRSPAIVLTGGANFTIANINAMGTVPPPPGTQYTPRNLIRLEPGDDPAIPGKSGTTGIYRAGTISNVQLALSNETAVIVASNTQLIGVKFNDFTFDDIGIATSVNNEPTTPQNFSAFQFNSTKISTAEINRPLMVSLAERRSFVHNLSANNTIYLNDIRTAGGNKTPPASQVVSSVVVDNSYQYTPNIAHATNVASSTSSVWDYVFLSPSLVQVSGRCTIQPTAAGNCVVHISLPVPSVFTDASQASGSFIAGTSGSNIAGAVLASPAASAFEVRWVAPNATNRSFSFIAVFRVQ